MEVVTKTLQILDITEKTKEWCKLPYPDHTNGCPNFGKREDCPPTKIILTNEISEPFYFIGVKFDLEEHAKKMKERNPEWTDRQCRCVLYWQPKVRKVLKDTCENFIKNKNLVYYTCPEALGLNLFTTCAKHGIKLDHNPQKIVWKIAIVGKPKNIINIGDW